MSSAGTAALQYGELAAAAASTAALALVIACALLGPWIARGAMRLLAVPARRLGGAGGYLAAASARQLPPPGRRDHPIVLVVAFVGVQPRPAPPSTGRAAPRPPRPARAARGHHGRARHPRRGGPPRRGGARRGRGHRRPAQHRRAGLPRDRRAQARPAAGHGRRPAALSATLDPAVLPGRSRTWAAARSRWARTGPARWT
ncbi:hypothetical protein O1L44_07880 [Streptomyces noursei]|nr:hypothetical protein [Streptomyces noursei]